MNVCFEETVTLAGKCVRGHDRLAWNTRPIWRAQCRLNLDLHLYSIIIIEPVVKTRFNDTIALLEFSSRREFVALRHLGQFLSFLVKIFDTRRTLSRLTSKFHDEHWLNSWFRCKRESGFRMERNFEKWWKWFIAGRRSIDRSIDRV